MRYYIASLVVLFLVGGSDARAEPYIYAGANILHDSLTAPLTVAATHPIDRVESSEKDNGLGVSVGIGYQWSSWYMEAGYTGLGRFESETAQHGAVTDSTEHVTRSIRESEGDAVEIKVGLLFPVSQRLSLYAEAGAHRYSNTVTTSVRHTQRDESGAIIDSSAATMGAREKKDSDAMCGLGLVYALPGTDALKVGVSHYGGIDRTGLTVAFHFAF